MSDIRSIVIEFRVYCRVRPLTRASHSDQFGVNLGIGIHHGSGETYIPTFTMSEI